MKKRKLYICLFVAISLVYQFSIDNLMAEEESVPSDFLEFQVVEFIEHYPRQWKGIADGGRLYWTSSKVDGAGIFIGHESVHVIPAIPDVKGVAFRELYYRLLFTGRVNGALDPVFLSLPEVQGVSFSLSGVTAIELVGNARRASHQGFHRTYIGIQTPPREIALGAGFFFLPGLDILTGVQYGTLLSSGTKAEINSPFLALEPNLRFRLDLNSRISLSLLLPARLIWMSPISFETGYGKKTYSTDVQGGLSLGISIVL